MNSKLNCRWPLFPVRGVFSLAVQNLHIRSLGLRSLRSVSGGLVLLHNNSQLCYTSSLPWDSLLHPTEGPHRIVSHNQDAQLCGGLAHENAAPRSCKGPRGGGGSLVRYPGCRSRPDAFTQIRLFHIDENVILINMHGCCCLGSN